MIDNLILKRSGGMECPFPFIEGLTITYNKCSMSVRSTGRAGGCTCGPFTIWYSGVYMWSIHNMVLCKHLIEFVLCATYSVTTCCSAAKQ